LITDNLKPIDTSNQQDILWLAMQRSLLIDRLIVCDMIDWYVDMDGVLADFDAHYFNTFGTVTDIAKNNVDWDAVNADKDFFFNIPPKPDMQDLWNFLMPFNPKVLTGVPKVFSEQATENKERWIRKHLGNNVEVICTQSANKYRYCKPGDILIDDWERYKEKWLNAGGIWITHTSAAQTIGEIKEMLNSVQA